MKKPIRFSVNGNPTELWLEPQRLLLDVLRDDLGLTGTKSNCGLGVCGTCTVLVDRRPASSCLVLAGLLDGRDVVTVEGLAPRGQLDTVQAAFIETGAFECGFCTSGMIVSARAFLNSGRPATRTEIAEFMGGNLCRCTGYENIFRAIDLAGARERASQGGPARANEGTGA
ncbi:MAG: (2Fe-2S)-binding protein [Candidatus Rokubacteria bacterium]|nr:(2Fe-2S)-binding protein [Candidatus Rokubacteria bacterium]